MLNQQAKERLNLERELAGDEEKAFSELSEEDRLKRQQILKEMTDQLSRKLDGKLVRIMVNFSNIAEAEEDC